MTILKHQESSGITLDQSVCCSDWNSCNSECRDNQLEISYLGERIRLKTPWSSRCGHRYPFFCSFIACTPPAAVVEQGKKSACFFPLVLGKSLQFLDSGNFWSHLFCEANLMELILMMMMLTSKLLDGFQNSMDLMIILLSKLHVKQNLMDLMIMLTK